MRSLSGYETTSYVVNTIKHYCYDYIRRSSRSSKKVYTGLVDDVSDQIPDTAAAIEENYIQAETIGALEKAMLQLSERDRDLLYVKYDMERRDQRIGELLNIPCGNIFS